MRYYYAIPPTINPIKLRFRWLNKRIAKSLGYFWQACPICGTYYGGHEWSPINSGGVIWKSYDNPRSGHGTCPQCPGDWVKEKRRVIRDVG